MTRGLQRSINRGTPIDGLVRKLERRDFTETVAITGAAGNGWGTLPILKDMLPEGNIMVLGVTSKLTLDASAGGVVAAWNGDIALGSAPVADGDVFATTDDDISASKAVLGATKIAADVRTTVPGSAEKFLMLDNSADTQPIHLNIRIDDADVSADFDMIVTGSIYFAYLQHGDS